MPERLKPTFLDLSPSKALITPPEKNGNSEPFHFNGLSEKPTPKTAETASSAPIKASNHRPVRKPMFRG